MTPCGSNRRPARIENETCHDRAISFLQEGALLIQWRQLQGSWIQFFIETMEGVSWSNWLSSTCNMWVIIGKDVWLSLPCVVACACNIWATVSPTMYELNTLVDCTIFLQYSIARDGTVHSGGLANSFYWNRQPWQRFKMSRHIGEHG